MGRPTLCTPELTRRITERIANGLGIAQALTFGPLPGSTHYAWMARGQAAAELAESGETVPPAEAVFLEYRAAINKAADEFEAYHLNLIQEAAAGRPSYTTTTTTTRKPVTLKNGEMARGDDGEILFVEEVSVRTAESATYSWQASAWLLERTRRDRYSRTVNQVHTGPNGGPMEVATAEQRRSDLLAEIEAWREREAASSASEAEARGAVNP